MKKRLSLQAMQNRNVLRLLFLLCLFFNGIGDAWGEVISGTTYPTLTTNGLPTGWSGDGSGTSYIQLIASSNYIQTDNFCQSSITSIAIKARKYGGPNETQGEITISWYDAVNQTETILGTISPTSTNLTDYTLTSFTNTPTSKETGYLKFQCKGASSSKGCGISSVTVIYTNCHTINPTSSNANWGTVTLTGNIITATPATGFRVSTTTPYTVTTGTATVTDNGDNTFTVDFIANCTVQINFEAIPIVTATSNDNAWGTVSVTGNIITATPATGFRVSTTTPYTVTTGTATVTDNGDNTFTVNATSDCTVQINFEAIPTYTITWSINGVTTTTTNHGTALGTLPAATSCDITNYPNHYGWSTTDIGSTAATTAPTLITEATIPTGDATYYAVFSDGNIEYNRVNSNLSDWSGQYLIAYNNSTFMDGALAGGTIGAQNKEVSPGNNLTGNVVAASWGDLHYLTLVPVTNGYVLKTMTNDYIYHSSNNNAISSTKNIGTASSYYITITYTNSSDIKLCLNGNALGAVLRYNNNNNSSSGGYFRFYKDGGQEAVYLYKRTITATAFVTECAVIPCATAPVMDILLTDNITASSIYLLSGITDAGTGCSITEYGYVYSSTNNTPTIADSQVTLGTALTTEEHIETTLTGLNSGTTYYVRAYATNGFGTAYSDVESFTTLYTNAIEVIEWMPNGMIIDPGIEEATDVQVEKQIMGGLVADDLFFSKYYEATGNVKLIAIYNGTGQIVSLDNYRIQIGVTEWNSTPLNLGDIKASLAPNEELIIYNYNSSVSQDVTIIDCATSSGVLDLSQMYQNSNIVHSGRQTYALEKKNGASWDMIDLMGATNSAGNSPIAGNCIPSWGDITNNNTDHRTWCAMGESIDDGSALELSMNRCLLIRKNNITSGQNAVSQNVNAFNTLSTEWRGMQVEMGTDGGVSSSCLGFGYVGAFDFMNYYQTFENIGTTVLSSHTNTDGTFTLPITDLDQLSCTQIRLSVLGNNSTLLTQEVLQVPIMVTANATTDDNTYFGHTEEVCRTCDVVVRDGATLTKATDGATDDRAEVRDLTIYPGATLKVPTGTNYTAASLIMRAKNDVVSEATITGTLNISNLYHDRRMDGKQYYFFCLPYDCAVADLIYSNGKSLGLRGTDWEIKYYDGANRATSSGTSGSWRAFTDATLQAGIGYIIAIDATGDETKEVRFPMSYAAETTDKSIAVDDHGITTAITPNHKGWNLIGNPFLAQYSATPGSGLIVGALELDADGEYVLNTTAGVPYVTIPMNGGDYYIQERANNRALSPFTSFFVQVAGTDPSVDETNLAMLFIPSDRVPAPQMESDSYDNPLWIPVTLSNDTDNDVTTIVLHQSYSSDYEIGADLEKMMGSTTKPQLYSLNNSTRMAFNALPDSVSQHILLGYKAATAGDYTFTVQQDKVMPYVKAIWLTDNSESKSVNLLTQPYAFTTAVTDNSSRFLLSIDVDREVPSSVTDGLIDEPLVTTKNLTIEVRHLPESGTIAVIDALGRVIEERSISATEMLFTMPQQGIYLVRITSNKGSFIVKCIVK